MDACLHQHLVGLEAKKHHEHRREQPYCIHKTLRQINTKDPTFYKSVDQAIQDAKRKVLQIVTGNEPNKHVCFTYVVLKETEHLLYVLCGTHC